MSAGNGANGSRLHLLNPPGDRNAKDSEGRLMRGNATVFEAHQIAIEEGNRMHAFYLQQIPEFMARMIMDGLAAHGLLGLMECASCRLLVRAQDATAGTANACPVCKAPLTPVGIRPQAPDAPPAETPADSSPADASASPPAASGDSRFPLGDAH